MLGRCYDEGYGIKKDLQQAIFWFKKSAVQGYAPAQNKLAICYFQGDGVEKNEQEGLKLFTKAAEQGNSNAQYNLAVRYYNGEGVAKDYDNAMKWALKSAAQGHDQAQFLVGILYEYGLGCQKDIEKAKEWYQQSANQGYEQAKKALAELDAKTATVYNISRIVPYKLKLQDDVVLVNKTPFNISKITVKKGSLDFFTKSNIPSRFDDKILRSNKQILSQLLGATISIQIESSEAAKAKAILDVVISEESHDLVLTIVSDAPLGKKK